MVALSRLAGAAPPSPRPGSERPGKQVRPGQRLLDPGEASRSPGRGAGAHWLARGLRVRAAGRRRADSGALRERRGSHSDEIPVPGQRQQPASAFLLPSQIETEGGGREVEKKKKKSQPEREGGEAPAELLPDPLVSTSAFPRGLAPGAPAAERPRSPSSRWAGAPALPRKTRIDQTRKEFFSTANEQEARLPAFPSPPPRPGPPPSPPRPPSPPLSFLLGLCSGLRGCGRSQPAAAEPGRASRAGLPPSASSHLELPAAAAVAAGGPSALAGGSCSVLSIACSLSLSLSFFFLVGFLRGGLAASLRL
ncbi:unnamed protein product, partial [Rangifer tarandus platyrhynchus]